AEFGIGMDRRVRLRQQREHGDTLRFESVCHHLTHRGPGLAHRGTQRVAQELPVVQQWRVDAAEFREYVPPRELSQCFPRSCARLRPGALSSRLERRDVIW